MRENRDIVAAVFLRFDIERERFIFSKFYIYRILVLASPPQSPRVPLLKYRSYRYHRAGHPRSEHLDVLVSLLYKVLRVGLTVYCIGVS